jgi:hypothetical protein
MHAAGLHKWIERFRALIDGLQREMEAVQSDPATSIPRSAPSVCHTERPRITADALQKLIRHKSYATTQR